MKNLALTDTEYVTVIRTLKEALIAENFGQRHEELSLLYHTLGGRHGYGEES